MNEEKSLLEVILTSKQESENLLCDMLDDFMKDNELELAKKILNKIKDSFSFYDLYIETIETLKTLNSEKQNERHC